LRWNEDYQKLVNYDGYIIPGGFSYEDRVRGGMIASKDPIMEALKKEVKKGKPLIGICNGAQIVVESGLIPGVSGEQLAAALAVNKRIKDGKVLGTGFYNTWSYIKNDSDKGRCAFTYNIEKGHQFSLPVAHGEGRFMMEEELLKELIDNGQTVWRYCDEEGETKEEFPVNPNGASYNLAGICNPKGNVMALMPHPERTPEGQCIFESMKEYISVETQNLRFSLQYQPDEVEEPGEYQPADDSIEILVDMIITDNEARSMAGVIHQLGYNDIEVKRKVHWEVKLAGEQQTVNSQQLIKNIILSNELLNTSKEVGYVKFNNGWKEFNKDGNWSDVDKNKIIDSPVNYLVKYHDDVVGQSKLATLIERFGLEGIESVTKRVLWQVYGPHDRIQELLKENIFCNPYSQEMKRLEIR